MKAPIEFGDGLVRAVGDIVADVLDLDGTSPDPEASLLELGADSFSFVDIVLRLERRFGVSLPRDYAMPEHYSVKDLAGAVATAMGTVETRSIDS